MGDVERITTTERHAELREQIAQALHDEWCDYHGLPCAPISELSDSAVGRKASYLTTADVVVDAVLPFIAAARDEGYLAGLERWEEKWAEAADGARAERVRVVEGLVATIKALDTLEDRNWVRRARVLAVVEAARGDALDLANHPGPDAETDEWMNTPLGRQEAAREDTT